MFGGSSKPSFGAAPAVSSFGFNANTAATSPFGGQPAFGKPATPGFGQQSAFGQQSNMFGTTQPSGLFGGNQAPAFGQAPTQQSGFGAFAQQQQANNTLFGSSLQQNKPSIFGQPSTSAFGAAKPTGAFGFGSPTTHQPQTSLFGQASTSTTANTSFGGFGTNATSGGIFGATATPAFGQAQQPGANGSAIMKYQPLHGTDTIVKSGVSTIVNTKQHCITAMKEYESKSLEEIRIEDYTANRKGPQAGGIGSSGGMFGTTNPAGGGLFAPASQPSTGLFGQQQPAANALGGFGTSAATNSLGGFGQPQSAFGQATPAQSTGLFGKSSFGAPPTSTAFGGFGTAAPANTNLFGTKPFGQQSGGLFGQTAQVSGTSTFGQAPATGFGGFGQTSVNQPAPLFGAAAATNTGFGAAANTGFGGFGTNTNANTVGGGGGLFTQKPATGFGAAPAFGAVTSTATGFGTFGQANTSGSMFNNAFNKPASTFGGFGTQSTAPNLGTGLGLGTTNTLFGQSKPGGLFGASTAPTGGLFGSTFGQSNTLGGLGQNTIGMGQGLGMQQQQVPIHQQILAMTTSPYGDNPIFKDLKPISGLSEDALRPTNPAAQKAILESSSSNQFKVTPNVGNGLKVKPIQTSLSKKSLFGGLEEFDSSVEESFCLKPNAKRLVLKPKSAVKSPNQSKPLQSTQNTSFTGSADSDKQFTTASSKDTATAEQTFNNQIPTNQSTQNVDQENVRRVSWLHSKALEKAVRPRSSDFHENTIKELVTVPLKETLKQTSKQTSAAPVSAELQTTSPRESNLTFDLSHQHNTPSSPDSSFATHSFLDDTNPDLSLINVAPNVAGITLTRAKYYTIPPLDKLDEYMDEDGSCIVPNFTIGRKGYGNVYFNEPIDIAGLNLDELVHFRHKEVIIYPDDENKPPVGTELNRKAQITLDQVWPHDKTLHEAIKDKERLELMDYESHLRRVCEKHDTRFIEYRPETGSWVFRVDHFSKYGLNDSDEDDTPADPKKAKLVSSTTVVPDNSSRNLVMSGATIVDMSKTPVTTLTKTNQTAVNDVSLSSHTLGGYSSRYDLTDHMDEYGVSQHRFQPRSPSAVLAMDMGSDSHKLQLMKASFFADDDYDGKSILSEQLEGRDSPDQIVPNRPGIRSHMYSAASSMHSHSRGLPSTISSVLEIPVPGLVVKDLELTVIENQTTKVTRPTGPKSAPLVVKPKVASIRFPNTVIPLSKSIGHQLNGKCASDVALMKSRSFKVGWGPQNKIFVLNTINNNHKLGNKTDQLSSLLKGRMKDDNSGNLVQGLQIASMNQIRSFHESIENHLAVQLKFSTKHSVNDSDCPHIRGDSGTQIINEHLNIAKLNVKLGDVGDYVLSVWSLVDALWGDQEELDGQETNSHLTIMRRKELLSEWLEDVVTCKTIKSVDDSVADGYLNHLLQLLSCHKVDDACDMAFNNNDMNLALLMAQLSSGPMVRQLIQHQLSTWQEVEADKFIKVQRLKVMMLVAGVPLITSANGPVNIFEDMNWLKAFATILWYISSAPSSITDSLCTYEEFFQADEFPAEPPLPPYSGNYEPCSNNPIMDLRFHLLKLYSKRSHPMETILNPTTYTADQMDFRLSWLLLQTLSSIGYHHCSELSAAQLHVSFASQLENHGLWHWSIFVLLHIDNRNQREMAIQSILYKYVSLSQDEDYLEREQFVINDLGVPDKWIYWAKSVKAGVQNKYHKQADYLLRAKQWPAAHDVIMKHLAADAIINDDIPYLKELLGQLENPRLIPNWSNEGMILIDYVEIMEKYESLKTIHERDIETRWDALKPQLNELCSRISLFPCPTAKHRLCQSEISQRLANLVNGMRIVCPDLSPLIEMKLTIGKLPLPQEYAQQKLRFFLDDGSLMDML